MLCNRMAYRVASFAIVAAATSISCVIHSRLEAGEIRLKNDMHFEGRTVSMQSLSATYVPSGGELTTYPVTMVNAGMQRYYVPSRNVVEANNDAELSKYEKFKLKQKKRNQSKMLGAVGLFADVTNFNEFGQRSLSIKTAKGPLKIDQGITEIGPKYMKISALNYAWEYAISTRSVPPQTVDKMIRQVTDQQNQNDRYAIVRFYIQAKLYLQALIELEKIQKEFPLLKEKVAEDMLGVRQKLAQTLIDELERRKSFGQHALAYAKAKQFPTDQMSAAILRQVRDFIGEYDSAKEAGERLLATLGELQAEIQDATRREMLDAMRLEVTDELNYESMKRLQSFIGVIDNAMKKPEEKLALAYTGWMLGNSSAVDRLDVALSLWQARFLILNYLRSPDKNQRTQILADLLRTEHVGPENIYKLIENLPAQLETPGIRTGVSYRVEVDNAMADVPADSPTVKYQVVLPPEYTHHRIYPMVVALHSVERSPEWELRWWAGKADDPLQAQRNGYIVIVPEYVPKGTRSYDYSPLAHYRVIQSIRDARKRFNVDSDRVFLAGHGTGGDAVFDIGMAHPDLFAGIVPITGVIDGIVKRIYKNARHLPVFSIGGQLDRDTFERNAKTFTFMMMGGFDLTVCEFVGRGYESYYGEIHRIFEWMQLQRRRTFPPDFTMLTMRQNNNRHFWLKSHTFASPRRSTNGSALPTRARTTKAEILTGSDRWNTIAISSASRKYTIWLSPDMLDFDKRLRVMVKGKAKFNGFVESTVETMLEDLRIRGDRQKVYEAKIEIE